MNRPLRWILWLTACLSWACASPLHGAEDPEMEGGFIHVLALDCEIHIPAYYTVQTQDRKEIAFFSPRPLESGRITIRNDPEELQLSPDFQVVSSRQVSHLTVSEVEIRGEAKEKEKATEKEKSSDSFISIRSKDQELTLVGDATRFADEIVSQCTDSISEAARDAYKSR